MSLPRRTSAFVSSDGRSQRSANRWKRPAGRLDHKRLRRLPGATAHRIVADHGDRPLGPGGGGGPGSDDRGLASSADGRQEHGERRPARHEEHGKRRHAARQHVVITAAAQQRPAGAGRQRRADGQHRRHGEGGQGRTRGGDRQGRADRADAQHRPGRANRQNRPTARDRQKRTFGPQRQTGHSRHCHTPTVLRSGRSAGPGGYWVESGNGGQIEGEPEWPDRTDGVDQDLWEPRDADNGLGPWLEARCVHLGSPVFTARSAPPTRHGHQPHGRSDDRLNVITIPAIQGNVRHGKRWQIETTTTMRHDASDVRETQDVEQVNG
jgi:hypothetical protein